MNDVESVTAAVIIIGDEILSGRTVDKNSNFIAKHLVKLGITLRQVSIIPDIESEIVDTVNTFRKCYDYVFTTGGIGPTHDDITADSIARAFNTGIDVDIRALDMMRKRYKESELHGDRLRMARIPKGADLIENQISQTPGFMLENVIVMAGIPKIMQIMLENVTPKLRTGPRVKSLTVRVIVPESQIATILREVNEQNTELSLGSYPFFENDQIGSNIVLRSTNHLALLSGEKLLFQRSKSCRSKSPDCR